jgi:hypothetical protein
MVPASVRHKQVRDTGELGFHRRSRVQRRSPIAAYAATWSRRPGSWRCLRRAARSHLRSVCSATRPARRRSSTSASRLMASSGAPSPHLRCTSSSAALMLPPTMARSPSTIQNPRCSGCSAHLEPAMSCSSDWENRDANPWWPACVRPLASCWFAVSNTRRSRWACCACTTRGAPEASHRWSQKLRPTLWCRQRRSCVKDPGRA